KHGPRVSGRRHRPAAQVVSVGLSDTRATPSNAAGASSRNPAATNRFTNTIKNGTESLHTRSCATARDQLRFAFTINSTADLPHKGTGNSLRSSPSCHVSAPDNISNRKLTIPSRRLKNNGLPPHSAG